MKTLIFGLALILIPISIFGNDDISFSIDLKKDTFEVFEPIRIEASITNNGDSAIEVNPLKVINGGLQLQLYKDDELISMNIICGWLSEETEILKAGESKNKIIDLTKYYYLFDEGNYSIAIEYIPSLNKSVESKSKFNQEKEQREKFVIEALREKEKKALEIYSNMIKNCVPDPVCYSYYTDLVNQKYPNTMMANEMKFLLGEAYYSFGKSNESITFFEDYLNRKSLPKEKENKGILYLACAHYESGDLKTAISILKKESEKGNTRFDKRIRYWERKQNRKR